MHKKKWGKRVTETAGSPGEKPFGTLRFSARGGDSTQRFVSKEVLEEKKTFSQLQNSLRKCVS